MTNDKMTLRNKLVDIALDWQENFEGTEVNPQSWTQPLLFICEEEH